MWDDIGQSGLRTEQGHLTAMACGVLPGVWLIQGLQPLILAAMTRRRRLLILFLALVVGIPLLAAIGIGAYLRSGGVERELAHGWTERGLPGQLRVESIR